MTLGRLLHVSEPQVPPVEDGLPCPPHQHHARVSSGRATCSGAAAGGLLDAGGQQGFQAARNRAEELPSMACFIGKIKVWDFSPCRFCKEAEKVVMIR